MTTIQDVAQHLCRCIHIALAPLPFFVGLTGGCLYKVGHRKDIDILIYRNRQEEGDFDEMLEHLVQVLDEFTIVEKHGFVTKAKYCDWDVDILFPEAEAGDYPKPEEDHF